MAGNGQALFDRRCKLTILNPLPSLTNFKDTQPFEVIEIDGGVSENRTRIGLTVRFEVKKTLKKEPNTSKITVVNLSPNRRASLQKKGVRLILEAGYVNTGLSRYFLGDVRTVDHVRNGPDWETVFGLGDGERAWKFAQVNESFSPGTLLSDALKKVGRAIGVGTGNLDDKAAEVTTVLDQGFACAGSATRAFDQLCSMIQLPWSVQDGELQLLGVDDVLDLPIPEIGPKSGLIGSPEMGSPPKKNKPQLVKFKSLLTPTKPGAKVKLKSERYPDGSFVKVYACDFKGDTAGGDWYTEISGVILK